MKFYMLSFQGDSRASKEIPFKVVKEYDHYVLLESMVYPSAIGLSSSFKMSAFPRELRMARTMNEQQFISWVEKRKEYVDTVFTAHRGNPRSIKILRKWDEIKAELRR